MKAIAVAVLGIVATIFQIQETDAEIWSSIKMKTLMYNNDTVEANHIDVPKSIYDPDFRDYVKIPCDNEYNVDYYCQENDPRVCILLDKTGNNPAGIQLSFLEGDFKDVDKRVYDLSAVKAFEVKKIFNITVYSLTVFFTNPCTLSESGRRDTYEVAEALWIKIDGEWVSLQRCKPNGPRMGDFYLQACYPKLGTVYVYKLHKYTNCRDAFLFYVSYGRSSLVEFGIVNVGRGGSPGPKTDWYTRPEGRPLAEFFPAAPECFKSYHKYGFTSLQVFLIDNPEGIKCLRCRG